MTDAVAIQRIASTITQMVQEMETINLQSYPEKVRAIAQAVVDIQKGADSGDPDCPSIPEVPEA